MKINKKYILIGIVAALCLSLLLILDKKNRLRDPDTAITIITRENYQNTLAKGNETYYLLVCEVGSHQCDKMAAAVKKSYDDKKKIYLIDTSEYVRAINEAPEGSTRALAAYRGLLTETGAETVPTIMFKKGAETKAAFNGYYSEEYYNALSKGQNAEELEQKIEEKILNFMNKAAK